MARVNHVKRAQKDYPEHGIKKGESYYWWKLHMRAPKQFSKTPPKASQLTSSDFLRTMSDIEERIGVITFDMEIAEIKAEVDDIVAEIQNLSSEQQEKLDNMPEGLQQGQTGELLQERIEACEDMASSLDSIEIELEREEKESDEDWQARVEQMIQEIHDIGYNGS